MKNLTRLTRMIYASPLAITPAAFAAIDWQYREYLKYGAVKTDAVAADINRDVNKDKTTGYETRPDGVAVVSLRGICGRHLSDLDIACGGCDVEAVAAALRAADDDPVVKGIILDIDSPGGSVGGVNACADTVLTLRKPCIAYVSELCASAAYWIASQCDAIYIDSTADVGSVGVYCAFLDESKKFEMEGLKTILTTTGANKGRELPGLSLSDENLAVRQSVVDDIFAVFKWRVTSAREEINEEFLDGRTLVGETAVKHGFADEVASFEDAARDVLLITKKGQ